MSHSTNTTANVIANYLGKGWATLMGVVFLPLYIQILGVESYGLIGAFAVLQAAMLLLDFGLTPTLNRETARLKGGGHSAESIRDLLRSIEILCVLIAIAMAFFVFFASDVLAGHWLQPEHISRDLVERSVQMMGLVLAGRWVEQIYRSALLGLQDQIWLNGAQALLETLRWGGACLFLLATQGNIISFFIWQMGVSLLTIIALAWRTHSVLPVGNRPAKFSSAELRKIWKFASGMFVSAILVFLLTQMDKILVGRLLSLSSFAIYMLASTAAGGLLQLITPMNAAIYPKMAQHVAADDTEELARLFLAACQWLAAILAPPALILAIFPEATLLAWTGDSQITQAGAATLSTLSLAMLFNGFMNLPYMLQLAYGWTSLSNRINALAIFLVIPLIMVLVPWLDTWGAAIALLGLNIVYVVVAAPLMFRRLLRGQYKKWLVSAVLTPLIAGVVAGLVVRLALDVPHSRSLAILDLITAIVVITVTVAASLEVPRKKLLDFARTYSIRRKSAANNLGLRAPTSITRQHQRDE